jgi:hypothetical protein
MRVFRVDGKEQDKMPEGFGIARDGKSTPIAPDGYPHKVEYLDTTDAPPKWILVCNHKRDFPQELAWAIHGKFCHASHTDGCDWHYSNWDDRLMCPTRRRYLDKANAMLTVLHKVSHSSDEMAFNLAIRILETL